MKLNTRFSLVAAGAAVMMVVLVASTIIGNNFINSLKDYQTLQQNVIYGVSDISNFLNKTCSWAIEPETINTEWSGKLISLNKQFHNLAGSSVLKVMPEEFQDCVTDANGVWTKIVNRINPFNSQYKTIQGLKFTDEELSVIRRYGIVTTYERFPDSQNVKDLYGQQLLIRTQMRDLMKEETKLQGFLKDMNAMLVAEIEKSTKIFNFGIVGFSVLLIVVLFFFIRQSTSAVTKNIKRVRDFSSSLSEKDFRNEIQPKGSNEMKALMNNMNEMVRAINDFFIVVKKTASRAISSGYSINDSATSTAAATTEINSNIEEITREFEQINDSLSRAVQAISEINSQVKTLVSDNDQQAAAIDDSTLSITTMAQTLVSIRENAELRTKNAEEMRNLVADGDDKISSTTHILKDVMSQLDAIDEIVTIIDSISEQTNLLSMNAAIESAHAGEYGKGFAVVAEEIRSLAESTADNAKKINESISNVIKSVTLANDSSISAAEAFSKVSSHSAAVIDSFAEITRGIENLDVQTQQVTQKTEVTAATADKINDYCTNLASQQETISSEISSISRLFNDAVNGIRGIKVGTEDIVTRMAAVGDLSKESYKNMTDLENVLEEFKTTVDQSEELKEEMENDAIENIISPELQAQLEADFSTESHEGDETVEFDPDAVEDVSGSDAVAETEDAALENSVSE